LFTDEQEQINDQYTELNEEIFVPKLSDKQEVAKVYEWIYAHCVSFRYSCYLITSIWSVGFLLEFLARLTLILLHLSVNNIVIYGHIILSSITVLCIVSSIICITIERKYTLAFIEQWKEQQQQHRRSVELSTSFVTIKCNSNGVSTVDI